MSTPPPHPPAWAGHDKDSREYRRILIGLVAAGIATFAQIYSPQGALPVIARSLETDAATAALSVSLATLGVACAVIPWSWVADRIGLLTSMRIAITSSAVFGVLVAASPSLEFLLAIRFLEGVALAGLPALAVAYLHEEIHVKYAAVAAAAYISGTTIGGASGRLISGPLAATFGWRPALLAVALTCAVAAGIFLALMPKPRGRRRPVPGDAAITALVGRIRSCLADPTLRKVYATPFLLLSAFVGVYNYLAFRLEAPPFSLAPAIASLIFLAYAAGTISSRWAGNGIPRLGSRRVMLSGLALMLIGVVVMAADWLPALIAGLLILTAGFFITHATAVSWAGRGAPRARAQSTALYNVSMYSGSAVGGWLIGYVFGGFGWIGVTVVCGLLIVAALVLTSTLPRTDEIAAPVRA